MRNSISGKVGRAVLASGPVLALALIAMPPAHAQTFTVLYTFTGGADGGTPMATPLLYKGNICGTTRSGGAHANGTVYALNFQSRKETVLHSFTGSPDGADPVGGLVQDSSGNFYGVAYRGGRHNYGTLFELTPSGTFTLLHSFTGPPSEGIGPAGTPIFDPRGNLFGTTYVGGDTTDSKGWGTVYEYSAKGAFTNGKSFSPGGALPRAALYYQDGKLYGTTYGGGAHQYYGSIYQAGFALALYSFTGGPDGSQPEGSLIGDGQGNLYGTTSAGGTGNFGLGYGVVFKYNLASGLETVLYAFTGSDGAVPMSALAWDSQGNLYGTTSLGGTFGYGTVFKLNPSSGELTTLHDFTGGSDGASPYAGVLVDAKGNIWGAASAGGSVTAPGGLVTAPGGYGTLFLISPGM